MIDDVQVRFGEEIRLDLGNTIPVPIRDYNLLFNRPFLNGRELVGMFVLKQSDIFNDVGYLSEETDPTVPAWAKQPQKPTYTAEEVGALSASVIVPTMVSQLTNDSHYYVVPAGGIPLKDLAPGIIPDPSLKLDARLKGVPGGVAELDSNGMVPPHQLPSYVDDVKSYTSLSFFPTVGEDDKIYIDKMTNKQYRWSGDPEVGYVPIASSLALGETSHTAYRGDRGKAAYDHALAKGSAFESGLYKFTTNAEGHIVAAIPVTKEDIVALGIPGAIPSIPTRVSDLQNDSNFLSEETDPTVPAWAKQPNKPTYTAQEVGAYAKPVGGIPASDLADGVIPDVSGFYTKPVNGIPASDLAAGVIPDVSGFYTKPMTGIPASDLAAGVIPTVPVTDVQINGTSILNNGVANIPKAGSSTPGVVRIDPNYGVGHRDAPNEDVLMVQQASVSEMKSGYEQRKPIVPSGQHTAVYYALAKLAGADMASLTGETVGVYPQAQKTAIQTMLGIEADIPLIEEVSGSTPSITGMPNVRYICGTCSLLTITPPASGSIVVRFTSGSTPTVLTVPNTVKFPVWFDYTSLEADTTYEIIITDGVYGGVMSWA